MKNTVRDYVLSVTATARLSKKKERLASIRKYLHWLSQAAITLAVVLVFVGFVTGAFGRNPCVPVGYVQSPSLEFEQGTGFPVPHYKSLSCQ